MMVESSTKETDVDAHFQKDNYHLDIHSKDYQKEIHAGNLDYKYSYHQESKTVTTQKPLTSLSYAENYFGNQSDEYGYGGIGQDYDTFRIRSNQNSESKQNNHIERDKSSPELRTAHGNNGPDSYNYGRNAGKGYDRDSTQDIGQIEDDIGRGSKDYVSNTRDGSRRRDYLVLDNLEREGLEKGKLPSFIPGVQTRPTRDDCDSGYRGSKKQGNYYFLY
jgi:hypothetical protein